MADIPAVAMAYRLAEGQNALLRRVRQAKAMRESAGDQLRGGTQAAGGDSMRPADDRPEFAAGSSIRS